MERSSTFVRLLIAFSLFSLGACGLKTFDGASADHRSRGDGSPQDFKLGSSLEQEVPAADGVATTDSIALPPYDAETLRNIYLNDPTVQAQISGLCEASADLTVSQVLKQAGYGLGRPIDVCKKAFLDTIVAAVLAAYNGLFEILGIDLKCKGALINSCALGAAQLVVTLFGDEGKCPSPSVIAEELAKYLVTCSTSAARSCGASVIKRLAGAQAYIAITLLDILGGLFSATCEGIVECHAKLKNGWGGGNCAMPFNSCVQQGLGTYGNNCTFAGYQTCMQCCREGGGGMTDTAACKCSCAFYFGKTDKCSVGGVGSYFDTECAAPVTTGGTGTKIQEFTP